MAVKVYTPGQFYAAGGVVEEMFYQEVGRTKKYLRKRVGFVRSFEQVIKNLNDEAWREFHYMEANVRGVDYTLVYDLENKEYPYLFVETKFYFKQKAKVKEPDRDLLKKIGELFIFGIICILVVTITIIIIKPYA
jgi:hypothetical protein